MERIIIDDRENICCLCCKDFKHRVRYWGQVEVNSPGADLLPKGLKLVEMITFCCSCRNLLSKKKKLEEELDNLNFLLFCKQFNLRDNAEYM
jgi:hypothetical protein